MVQKSMLSLCLLSGLLTGYTARVEAQESPDLHVVVNLVQLNVAVTDKKGNYITGLPPSDFSIVEDGIEEKIATFAEGNEPAVSVNDPAKSKGSPDPPGELSKNSSTADSTHTLDSLIAGANVFILFDTSTYMYRGFVFAQDAISDFVRSLETADKVAFYSYSRDLYRSAPLTADRSEVVRGVRTTVAGDDAALYNSLLLTLKDASSFTGRKVVVVFSNGPDNASMVPPEDVA